MTPFEIRLPNVDAIPVLASIPHTGTYIPDAVSARLASDAMRALPMTDWHLHHLYDFLPEYGVTTVFATWSRFVADLNRPPTPQALYPGRFETGISARETFWGDVVWNEPPTDDEIDHWREQVHAPYHAELARQLDQLVERFGHVVLLDLHSVASRASKLHDELENDIYLGNRDETTCGEWLTDSMQQSLEAGGLHVVRNHPYKGGYITAHYGSRDDVDALQIEMCQRVYMDENDPGTALDSPRFGQAKHLLENVLARVFVDIRERTVSAAN